MTELTKDMTERKLGRQPHVCKICGTQGEFQTYLAREMMQNKRDEFVYFVCDECQCLQIADVPGNLGEYYGENYYSFSMPENLAMQFEKPVSNTDKILDVGCGSGVWLAKMAQAGYGNLHGCDPFLSQERHYGDRVYIRNCSIHEMDGDNTFDFIRMNDSFEHMTDPYEALQSAKRLLKLGGVLRMSIPTYPNIAFEMFGPHWYQLDAPRHIFLHSMKSLSYLSEKAGLPIVKIEYDSNDSQFVRSFFYERGVPFWEQTSELVYKYFQKEDILHMADTAAAVNAKGYGDHVKVWLQKIGE